MYVLFLFFVGTMFIQTNANIFKQRMFWKIIPKYNANSSMVLLPTLVNTDSSSDVSCGHQCASVDWCLSFAYDVTMTTCSLYYTTIPIVASTETSIYSERCPVSLGFTFETSLHFCYWISTYMDTWQAANNTCHNKGATLAKTQTADIFNFLYNFTKGTNVWVGGNDVAIEGTFVWTDGDSLQINDKIWDNGQPDGGQDDEDCCMIINWGPKLHDALCSIKFIFLCEYNL